MGERLKTVRGAIATAVALSLSLGVSTSSAAEHGPVAKIDVNAAKAELGKRLFFDRRLSGDAAISCADCHDPNHGFGSKEALSPGYPGNGHFRNAPSLINTAHKKTWMHDGRIGTNLNDVSREMITEDYIMNMDMRMMQERVKQDSRYLEMFKAAGMGEPSNGAVRKLLPEFMKTLTTRNAPVDNGTMSDAAKRGAALFDGAAGCNQCHTGALYSDGKRHNTGVPENLDVFLDPMNHQAYLAYGIAMGVENIFNTKRDIGAAVQSHEADGSDRGTFMTPQLRGLKYSAPYMHNGMLATLADVVDFYNQGGGEDSNKSDLLKPLRLTDGEKADLVAYLEALSGDALTSNEFVWSEPYPTEYEVIPNWTQVDNRTRAPIKK